MCLAPSQIILSMDEAGAIAPPIFTSVGQDAVNGAGDVFVIQSLLNKRLPTPHTEVPVTGNMDIGTILAIKAFQAVVMNMNPATGYVAPGSPTYYALAARPLIAKELPPPVKYGHVGIVPPDVLEAARTSRQRWGIPASVTLAQWIVESAWGAAMPPAQQQSFRDQSSRLPTRGRKRDSRSHRRQGLDLRQRASGVSKAWPRRSNSMASSCRRGRPYRAAMEVAKDPDRFADALTGVYATDPQYGATLKWVMENYRLKQYD